MTRLTDESGLAERVLVGVIAWAFAAVLMLTSTLVAANQIDDRVAFIRTQVSPIDTDLDSVKLAEETNRIAKDIETAAKPLSGQLDQVRDSTVSIDGTAASILQTAGEINNTVDSINSNALEINGTVGSINGKAKAINGSVRSIHGNVNSINETVHGIDGNFAGIRGTVFSIRGAVEGFEGFGEGLHGASRRIDPLLALIQGIKGDTGNVLALVGTVDKSAKSIDSKL